MNIVARSLCMALLALSVPACVSKAVHCKFVTDVDTASAHYADAAKQASNPGFEAEASELRKTVDSEREAYCK
jgi:hypothetical protein